VDILERKRQRTMKCRAPRKGELSVQEEAVGCNEDIAFIGARVNTLAFRRHSSDLGLPHALQFLDSNLPPDSIYFGRYGLGARSAIYWGLVMGIEHLPRNKQRRPAEPSLRVDENTDAVSLPEENDAPSLWGDEHSDDTQSLLEENALLRRILVKMDLVLKKVVDPK
jgi:hypothetical protein